MQKRTLEQSRINRNGLDPGKPAPDFQLPQVDGTERSLAMFRGRPLLLVFVDPNCEPCNQLVPRLQRLHSQNTDLQILLLSRGDIEANRAKVSQHGITLPVVLQQHWEVSRQYEIFATPVAYLINEQGVVVTNVAVGPDQIMALADNYVELLRLDKGAPMREQMQARLAWLRQEFGKGQLELQKLERQYRDVRETVIRITGAIQVLEELLMEVPINHEERTTENGVAPSGSPFVKESGA